MWQRRRTESYCRAALPTNHNNICCVVGRFVLVHDTHKSQRNYILYTEGVDGDTTDKCRQHQLNAVLSVLLSWWLSWQATSEILFHIKCCCFCSCPCLFIPNLPLRVCLSHRLYPDPLKLKHKASNSSLCTSLSIPSSSCALIHATIVSSRQTWWYTTWWGWRICASGAFSTICLFPRFLKNMPCFIVYLGVRGRKEFHVICLIWERGRGEKKRLTSLEAWECRSALIWLTFPFCTVWL